MHASHEPVAPPSDGRSVRRESRRGRILAATLALFTLVLATFAIIATRPPEASAQTETMGALTGQCVSGQAAFHLELTNSRATTFTFDYELSSSGPFAGVETLSGTVAPGAQFTADFTPVAAQTGTKWRTYFYDEALAYELVGQTPELANPCDATPPTDPPQVTYDVTCEKDTNGVAQSVLYAPTIKNPNTVPITYTLVRNWNDNRPEVVTADVVVAAGETVSGNSLNYSHTDRLTEQWTHTFAIKVANTFVGQPITKQNPCYAGEPEPAEPPEVTYEVTCQKDTTGAPESVLYAAAIKNPNASAITYTLVRGWDDDREDVTKNVEVAAGATVSGDSVNYSSDTGVSAEWTHTLTIRVGDEVVGEPITEENPCVTPPDDTSTTTDPTDTTTSTDIAAASNNGGNLATTGVAIVAVLGAGLVLFANGAGLMRLVRKGEHE